MRDLIADFSQHKAATVLRFLYPLFFIVGIFSMMYASDSLIVPGDAATTANNIMANELLFRMGIAGTLVVQIIHILVALALYGLFKSVNKNHALLMVIFALVGVPIAMFNELNKVAALILLKGADSLTAFTADQLQAQMMFFLDLNRLGNLSISAIFWGLWLLPLGYLVYKSGYFPRFIGVLLVMGGFGFALVDPLSHLLLSDYASYEAILMPLVALLVTPGELLLMGWLVFRGAKLPQELPAETQLERKSTVTT